MSWKFRKRIRACPGVRVNISRSGFSATIGVPGLSVNFGKKGTYLNVGVPGTGFYDRIRLDNSLRRTPDGPAEIPFATSASDIKSTGLDVGSGTMQGMRTALLQMRDERKRVLAENRRLKYLIERLQCDETGLKQRTSGMFSAFLSQSKRQTFAARANVLRRDVAILEKESRSITAYAEALNLPVFTEWTDEIRDSWESLVAAFQLAANCSMIWDITSESALDGAERARERTNAQSLIDRRPTQWRTGSVADLLCTADALVLGNVNGPDIFLYPSFIYIPDNDTFFDIRDLEIAFVTCHFTEAEDLPPDATTDGNTWAEVNKDGTPDLRFKGNYQIPIALYGQITLSSASGIREAYLLSDVDKAKDFFIKLQLFVDLLRPAQTSQAHANQTHAHKPPAPAPLPAEDPYDILGVSRDASMEEITRVYHSLAKIYHGDASTPGVRDQQMSRINGAYDQIAQERGT